MRINHNISALNTYNRLASNQVNGNKSLEKLSSGLRINKAGDDAAGLAISEKMRSQIRGLEMASKNAQDGISLVQTAEGALGETHAILQRMREMAVQAASDTNTSDDRLSIQKEIDQLVTEVDRIANSTEFNTKKLLNGGAGVSVNWDSRTNNGTNAAWIEIVGGTADTRLGNDIGITAADYAKGATYTATVSAGANATATGGVLTINGYSINIDAGANSGAVITAINEYSEYTGVTATAGGANEVVFNATQAGSSAKLELSGLGSIDDNTTTSTTFGTDAVITSAGLGTAYIANGNTITITKGDYKGLELKLNASLMSGTAAQNLAQFDITGNGAVALQIGANSGQEMSVSIGDMRAAALGVGTIDVTTLAGAKSAIATIDSAVTQVSAERSKLGAYQNRLEHTINNLGASAENLTAAESRIRDVDMAKEMMEFTKNNILTQAATAMLAQANQAPQAVLQLLR